MEIIIGADMVPTAHNLNLFISGKGESLVGNDLITILHDASFRIFNLETPLSDISKPIIKEGPNLIAPTNTINGYKSLGVDLLTLANNHIMDQGVDGLNSTIHTLDSAGIDYLGVGKNIQEASKPYFYQTSGKKIGIYACAEHEFSLAGEDKPGANAFDPLNSFDHIEWMKKNSDYVVVLYHGGKEHYRYPSPNLQRVCRKFVDKGANLVVCQHSHCVGCEEKYQGGTIVYGQGNFIFDDSNNECWNTSLLIRIDDNFHVSYIPIMREKERVRIANKVVGKAIMEDFYKRTKEIQEKGFVEEKYKQYADEKIDFYLNAFLGKKSIFFRVMNRLTRGLYGKKVIYTKYQLQNQVRIANYIDCESHRELVMQALANNYSEV